MANRAGASGPTLDPNTVFLSALWPDRGPGVVLRWCAAGMVEARKQLWRFNGHLRWQKLRAALEAHVAPTNRRSTRKAAAYADQPDRPSAPRIHARRDILSWSFPESASAGTSSVPHTHR